MTVRKYKRSEEKINENNELYRSIFKNKPTISKNLDHIGQSILWNKECETIFGFPIDEMQKEPVNDFIVSKDLLTEAELFYKPLINDKKPDIIDVKPKKKNDSLLDLLIQNAPIIHEGKQIKLYANHEKICKQNKYEMLRQVLYDISTAVHTTTKLNDLFPLIHKSLHSIINTKNFSIVMYDKLNDMLTYPYFVDETNKLYQSHPMTVSKSSCAYVIKTKKSFLRTEDVFTEKVNNRELEPLGPEAKIWLGVPLKIKNEVIGVITLQYYTDPELFSKKDVRLLEFVSERVALAIESKRIEEALRENEIKFKKLTEQSPNMIFINKMGRTVYVNGKFEKVMKYTKEELYSPDFDFLNLIAPEYVDLIKAVFIQHMKGKDVLPIEHKIINKKGKEINAILTTKLIQYNGENACLGIITNNTERKKTEVESRNKEESIPDLVKNMSEVIYSIDLDGKITYISPAIERITGYNPSEIIGRKLADFVNTRDSKKIREHLKKIITGQEFRTDYKLLTKSGDIRCIQMSGKAIHENGRITGMQGIMIEFTKDNKAEGPMKWREEWFQALIECSSDIIQVIDFDGIVRYVSPTVRGILGYISEELVGKPSIDIVHPDDKELFNTGFNESLKRPCQPVFMTCIYKHKDGTKRVLEGIGTNYIDNPAINGFVLNMRDVTGRKKAEEEIQQRVDDMHLINTINQSVNHSEDTIILFTLLSEEITRIFKGYCTRIYLLDEGKKNLVIQKPSIPALKINYPVEDVIHNKTLYEVKVPLKRNNIYQQILREKKSRLITDPMMIKNLLSHFTETKIIKKHTAKNYMIPDIRSIVIIPIISDEDLTGVIEVSSKNIISVRDIHRMEIIAGHLTTSLAHIKKSRILRENEHYYRSLIHSLHEDIMVINRDYKIVDLNNGFSKTVGLNRSEIIGRYCYEMSHGSNSPCYLNGESCMLREVFKTGEPCSCNHVHIKQDGSKIHVDILFSPLKNQKGEVIQVIETMRDVSDLMAAQEALMEEKKKLLLLLDYESLLSDAASFFNVSLELPEILEYLTVRISKTIDFTELKLLIFDQEYIKMFKEYSDSDHMIFQRVFNPEVLNDPSVLQMFEEIKKRNKIVMSDISESEPEIKQFLIKYKLNSVVAFPIRTAQKIIGFVYFGKASKYKWSKELVSLLYTLVELITNALARNYHIFEKIEAEKKETEAVKLVERTSRLISLGTFTAGIAHELNQPLAALKVKVDSMLYYGEQNPESLHQNLVKNLKNISKQAKRIDDIIQHLKSFIKQEKDFDLQLLEINNLIKKAVSIIKQKLIAHKITLKFDFDKKNPLVNAEAVLLEQVILNLVINSIEALDKSQKKNKLITIATRQTDENCIIEVIDNGPGIPDDIIDKIFDPFFTSKKTGSGMGLGLTIIQNIIVVFNGSISARNNDCGGAVFTITFPSVNLKKEI